MEETCPLQTDNVPLAVTTLRLIVLPILVYSFDQQILFLEYPLFLFAISTDFLDGYIAKKFGISSKFGFYFDVIVDFVFVSGMFLVFILEGFYPSWILFLMFFVFAQFLVTNFYVKQAFYDPVGKYYGSLMYGGIGLTLLFQEQIIYSIVIAGVAVSTVMSLLSRWAYFLRLQKHEQTY